MGKYNFNENEIMDITKRYVVNMESTRDISKVFNVDQSVIIRVLKSNNVNIISGSAFSLDYWINRGLSKVEAEYKVKTIKPIYVEYWLNKGFNDAEAKFKVELQTMKTERAYVYKYGDKGKEIFKDILYKKGKRTSPRCIDYWINKGYSEEDSKLMVSKNQRTYSRDILHEKYGDIIGEEKLNERNEKWQKTLKHNVNYESFQKKKDSNSLKFYKDKHGINYIEFYLNEQVKKLFNTSVKEKIINILKTNNYVGFLDTIKENYKYDIRIIHRISNLCIINDIFNKSNKEIKEDLIRLYPVRNKNGFGTTYSINGRIVRSLSEVKIYELLLNIGADFDYDLQYPNQKTHYKCDFYLKKFDLYIEYAGMSNIKKTKKNEKILESYDSRLKIKKSICVDNNLKFFFSNSVDEILNFIKNMYGKKD